MGSPCRRLNLAPVKNIEGGRLEKSRYFVRAVNPWPYILATSANRDAWYKDTLLVCLPANKSFALLSLTSLQGVNPMLHIAKSLHRRTIVYLAIAVLLVTGGILPTPIPLWFLFQRRRVVPHLGSSLLLGAITTAISQTVCLRIPHAGIRRRLVSQLSPRQPVDGHRTLLNSTTPAVSRRRSLFQAI